MKSQSRLRRPRHRFASGEGEHALGKDLTRRQLLASGALLAGTALLPGPLRAQQLNFFRIGTGSTSGTYFPIGGLIATALSNPPGSRSCERGGSCGVPGMIVVAQSTNGSVENVESVVNGTLESGFTQADVAYWAFHGTGIFESVGPLDGLRSIASLYPEAIHVVARRDAGIRSVKHLAGKRVSLDRVGSGTRVDALLILDAYGLGEEDIEAFSLAPGDAADLLSQGELDAFVLIAGTPAEAVHQLALTTEITLVPINGPGADALLEAYPYLSAHFIHSGIYRNVGATATLSVPAQWVVDASLDEDLVYQLTQGLWHPRTRALLDRGHPKGSLITLESALDGLGVPLHPGARRYYEEVEILPPLEEGSGAGEAGAQESEAGG